MTYIFKTKATMKPYNNKYWWIDNDIINEMTIKADNIPDALRTYKDRVNNSWLATITDNGLKHKEPMYIDNEECDPMQVGYVMTASSEFFKDYSTGYKKQYIDLWIEILETAIPEFN